MLSRSPRWLVSTVGLLFAGCLFPVQEKVDLKVCELASRPRDLAPDEPELPLPRPMPPARDPGVKNTVYRPTDVHASATLGLPQANEPDAGRVKIEERLQIPENLPGGRVPLITLPPLRPENEAARKAILDKFYPPLPPLGENPTPAPGPEGHALTLADLQRLALANSPLIRQAAANVESARGAAIQAGLPPNPTVGFEQDTSGTAGGAGYVGVFVDQVIRTANKLGYARAMATMDLLNAEVALRRAETDLAAQVRGNYFGVLVARENIRVSEALAKLTRDAYEIQLDQVRIAGVGAAYEPAQLRVLALQARANLVQARVNYVNSWKLLASALGLPGMPLTELKGRIDIPVPVYDHARVLAHVLKRHTDVLTADNTYQRSVYTLRLAEVTPLPDVDVRWTIQKDYTGPPFAIVHSIQVGIPLPIWDRNQGGIIQAQGGLVNASEEPHRVRDDLTGRVATAFANYEFNRYQVELYRDEILPYQVLGYRGVYQRYQVEGAGRIGNPPTFGDVVTAQQTLAAAVVSYITALGAMWQAVTDLASLLQTDDLFQIDGVDQPTVPVPCLDDLTTLPDLPCCHPCSPLSDPRLRGGDGSWPVAIPPVEKALAPK